MRLQGGQKETKPDIPTQAFNAASRSLLAIAIKRQRQLMGGYVPRALQQPNQDLT